jgi:AraC-like DNA-binding protein
VKYLFELVPLQEKPMLWGYKSTSIQHFAGFYHWHQCCEMLVIHEGNGSIIVNQRTYEIRRGMVFFFQPFQLHKVYANVSSAQPYIRSNIHFEPYGFEEKLRPFTAIHALYMLLWQGNHAIHAFDMAEMFAYVEQVLDMHARNETASGYSRNGDFEQSSLLIIQLLNSISHLLVRSQLDVVRNIQTRPFAYAEQMMQWIEEHYKEDIKLEDIAEAMHVSKYYLSRLFQHETGSSISHYLTARRIKIACQLLQSTPHSIERIGIEIGIPNPSYFIRLFKKVVGVTPLKYRKSLALDTGRTTNE